MAILQLIRILTMIFRKMTISITKTYNRSYLLLLYVFVSLITTYVYQETIIIPSIINADILNDKDINQVILELFYKKRWLSFVINPSILLLRVFYTSFCIFVGQYFITKISNLKYRSCLSIATKAQAIFVLYTIGMCIYNTMTSVDNSSVIFKQFSLFHFLNDSEINETNRWIAIPLISINLLEFIYWFVLSSLIKRTTQSKFKDALLYLIATYGFGYIGFVILSSFVALFVL